MFALRVAPLTAFLTLFFLIPISILILYSFGYSTAINTTFGFNLDNYKTAVTTDIYWTVMIRALIIGAITAVICVIIAFPFVYSIVLGPLRRHGEAFSSLSFCLSFLPMLFAFTHGERCWGTMGLSTRPSRSSYRSSSSELLAL